MLYVWKLYPQQPDAHGQGGEVNPIKQINNKNKCSFSSLAVFKSHDIKESTQPIIYAASNDKNIREFKDYEMTMVYEENVTYSQILCGYMRRVIVAGVAESDRPGSI